MHTFWVCCVCEFMGFICLLMQNFVSDLSDSSIQSSPLNFMYCNFCILIRVFRYFHFCSHHLKFMDLISFISFEIKHFIGLIVRVFYVEKASDRNDREQKKKNINKYFIMAICMFAKAIEFGEMDFSAHVMRNPWKRDSVHCYVRKCHYVAYEL